MVIPVSLKIRFLDNFKYLFIGLLRIIIEVGVRIITHNMKTII